MSETDGGTVPPVGEVVAGEVRKHGTDPRMVVFNETEYVPSADLSSMKDSLTRQRDEALAASSQTKETNTTLEAQVSDFQSKLGLTEGSLDDARKQILATQDGLSNREVALKKGSDALEQRQQEFANRELGYERQRISKEYGVDEEVLKEFKDPRDMEIAGLKYKTAKKPPETPPNFGSMSPSGGAGSASNPMESALNIIQNAQRVGSRQTKVE